MTYTHDQMLQMWMMIRYHIPANDPAQISVDPSVGVDTQRIEEAAMRSWYLEQLDTAEVSLLPVENLALSASVSYDGNGGCAITLPDRCRRAISVKFPGWTTPALVIDSTHPLARLQESPLSCGGINSPVAVCWGRKLRVTPASEGVIQPESLLCVVDDSPTLYRLDDRLLNTIPPVNLQT